MIPRPARASELSPMSPEGIPHERRYRHCQRDAHAGRRIQRRVRNAAGPRTRQDRHQGGARPRRRRGAARLRSDHGPDPHRRGGPEPGPPGLDRGRHPGRNSGLGRQPALRLGAALGRARLSGHRQRRFRDRGRRRPGIHEHGAALRASARRREDGQFRDDRHHDQGRPVGRLQRLSHGQHRRERRPAVADHARSSRTNSRSPRRTRPKPRRRPASSRTRSRR